MFVLSSRDGQSTVGFASVGVRREIQAGDRNLWVINM